jgi:3-deoxy-manno-octulosonate cytidylyltransferase (CMP-KDO synthetase)
MHTSSAVSAAPKNPIVLIPARMGSTRLPDKPLADIHGLPMIVHVWKRAMEAGIGPVYVACGEPEIVAAVQKAGGQAVLTRPDHPSGSDRIWEALQSIDPDGTFDAVINVQGDLPTIDPAVVQAVFAPLANADVDIATLAVEIDNEEDRANPSVVKAILETAAGQTIARALYFTRVTAPSGPGPHYHHIGLYAYRRSALQRFVTSQPGTLEQREKLEQLRALALGMRIDAALVDTIPLGVDTPADLEKARVQLGQATAGGI